MQERTVRGTLKTNPTLGQLSILNYVHICLSHARRYGSQLFQTGAVLVGS